MTEDQTKRAAELIDAREAIKEFLSARDPECTTLKEWAASEYPHVQKTARRIPGMEVALIAVADEKSCELAMDTDEPDLVIWWAIPRDVLERAMELVLLDIPKTLAELGVTGENE